MVPTPHLFTYLAYNRHVNAANDKNTVKELFKEALSETLEERRDLLRDILSEVFEDFVLSEAVREGLETESATREEVFSILDKAS